MKREYIIFETVGVTKSDNVSICIINDLSNELKDYIRNIFVNICQGDRINISFEYKSVLKDFIERINKNSNKLKNDEHLKGIVGELLSHALIRYELNNIKPVSVLFNLEEKSFKKGFDIIFIEKNNLELWFAEIKSGSLLEEGNNSKIKIKNCCIKLKFYK